MSPHFPFLRAKHKILCNKKRFTDLLLIRAFEDMLLKILFNSNLGKIITAGSMLRDFLDNGTTCCMKAQI